MNRTLILSFILLILPALFLVGCAAPSAQTPHQNATENASGIQAGSTQTGMANQTVPDSEPMENATGAVANTTSQLPANETGPTGCAARSVDWHYDPPNPVSGGRSLLVILWDPHREGHVTPSESEIEAMVFGPAPSVGDYFYNESGGRLELRKAGVLGWYDSIKDAEHYRAASDPDDADGDGWTSGHVEKWAEAIRKADKEFDFSAYDYNHDGVLSEDELGILIVIPQNSPFGTNRWAEGGQYPYSEPLIVDGVRIGMIAEWYTGNPPDMGTAAHELSHLYLGTPDMYFWFFQPYAAGSYSLMDNSYGNSRHDAYNKLRLGWLTPKTINGSGCYSIRQAGDGAQGGYGSEAGDGADALVLPSADGKEFFLIENRQRGEYYDSALPDSGISVWHVMEDPAVFGSLEAPEGVDEAMWSQVPPYDWGRRMIRQIRPTYGPPFDNYKALWTGTDLNGTPLVLRWHDGSDSRYAITNISESGPLMSITIAAAP